MQSCREGVFNIRNPKGGNQKIKVNRDNFRRIRGANRSGRGPKFAYKGTRIPTNVSSALRCWIGLFWIAWSEYAGKVFSISNQVVGKQSWNDKKLEESFCKNLR